MSAQFKLFLAFGFYFILLVVISWGSDLVFDYARSAGWELDFNPTRVSQVLASTVTLWVALKQRLRGPPSFAVRTKSSSGWETTLVITVNCERANSITLHRVEFPDFEEIEPIIVDPIKVAAGEINRLEGTFRLNDTARERIQAKWRLSLSVEIEHLESGTIESKTLRMWNPFWKGELV